MTLPILSYTPEKIHESEGIKDSYDSLESLYEIIANLTGSDCWAMTVNDEILWDTYENNNPSNPPIRENMYTNPELEFSKMKNKPEKIVIYMFGARSWAVIINRDNNSNKCNVKISYKSEEVYKWLTKPRPTNKREREIHYLESLKLVGLDSRIETMEQLLHFDKSLYDRFAG